MRRGRERVGWGVFGVGVANRVRFLPAILVLVMVRGSGLYIPHTWVRCTTHYPTYPYYTSGQHLFTNPVARSPLHLSGIFYLCLPSH